LNLNVPVDSTLPINLKVPVDLKVPIDLKVPVNLNVPVNIDLRDTQLNDVAQSLRKVIEPYARLMSNLPDDWSDMWPFLIQAMGGKGQDLLRDNPFIANPWPGFRTGLGATPTPQSMMEPLMPATPSDGAQPGTAPGMGLTGTPEFTPTPTLSMPTVSPNADLGIITATPSPKP
jgi:hypothetical protein